MRRLNRWRAPRWIRYWMIAATRLGDGWLWYSLAAILLVYGGPQRFAAVKRGDIGCDRGRRRVQAAEKIESSAAALPTGTALLVEGPAS